MPCRLYSNPCLAVVFKQVVHSVPTEETEGAGQAGRCAHCHREETAADRRQPPRTIGALHTCCFLDTRRRNPQLARCTEARFGAYRGSTGDGAVTRPPESNTGPWQPTDWCHRAAQGAVRAPSVEPNAAKPHARICGGESQMAELSDQSSVGTIGHMTERDKNLARFSTPIAATALAVALGTGVSAQDAPRTSWGDPDLQGIWVGSTLTPLERPSEYEGRAFLTREEVTVIETEARAPTADLHLVERFTRLDAETIEYEAKLADPTRFTQPWTVRFSLSRDESGRGLGSGPPFRVCLPRGELRHRERAPRHSRRGRPCRRPLISCGSACGPTRVITTRCSRSHP